MFILVDRPLNSEDNIYLLTDTHKHTHVHTYTYMSLCVYEYETDYTVRWSRDWSPIEPAMKFP